jgi:hypothetical protein
MTVFFIDLLLSSFCFEFLFKVYMLCRFFIWLMGLEFVFLSIWEEFFPTFSQEGMEA